MAGEVSFRKASLQDLPEIVRMLAEDDVYGNREVYNKSSPCHNNYTKAFDEISSDHNNLLVVGENSNKEIVSTLQLTFIPNISNLGGKRALIEAIMVDKKHQGKNIGTEMMKWVNQWTARYMQSYNSSNPAHKIDDSVFGNLASTSNDDLSKKIIEVIATQEKYSHLNTPNGEIIKDMDRAYMRWKTPHLSLPCSRVNSEAEPQPTNNLTHNLG